MKKVSLIILLLLVAIGMTSCSDKNSLQNYFLDNAEKLGFSSSTIPISLLQQEGVTFSPKQVEAIEAIDRVNMLFYRADSKKLEEYTTEKNNVKSILKNEKYEELINLGDNGVVKYIGSDDYMDEIVIFLADKQMGFAVTRIIGDEMTMEKFMELYKLIQQKQVPINLDLGNITNFISGK